MYKVIAIVLLIVGAVLLAYGLNAAHSVSSEVTQAVNGTPTDRSLWLIVGGLAGVVAGGLGLILKRSP
jgi:uncharacterized membrane protein